MADNLGELSLKQVDVKLLDVRPAFKLIVMSENILNEKHFMVSNSNRTATVANFLCVTP